MDFRKIFMANQVTLATRVRVEILKAITRQLATDDMNTFVKQFTSRPVLIVKLNERQGGQEIFLLMQLQNLVPRCNNLNLVLPTGNLVQHLKDRWSKHLSF